MTKRQRHDELASSLVELEPESRLFVMGLHGESSAAAGRYVGSQLETVVSQCSPTGIPGPGRVHSTPQCHAGI